MTKDEKKIEIYALSKKIDKVNVEELNGKVRIVVDLSQVEKEQNYLESKGLLSPIKEQAQFKKVQAMKEARKLLEETEKIPENQDMLQELEKTIDTGNKAVEYLIVTFKPCALKWAKPWIHPGRLNDMNDWNGIIDEAIRDAVMHYDLSVGTQFSTFLGPIVKRDCKENKAKDSIVATNASAMHKHRQIELAREQIVREGYAPDDLYALARAMKRDVSTPRKYQSFKEAVMDTDRIFAQSVSMEASVDENSRTIGESIASNSLSGEELLIAKDFHNRMDKFYDSLPKDFQYVVKLLMEVDDLPSKPKNLNVERVKERLLNNKLFAELITEGISLQKKGIISSFL